MKPDGVDVIADALGWDRATPWPQVLGIGWYPSDANAVASGSADNNNGGEIHVAGLTLITG